MPVRLIVTDLDGTLLRNDKTISAQSVSVLTQCREAGIKVVFATGRGSNASDMVVVSNSHFDGRVVGNGATAFIGNNIVYRKLLSCSSVRSLLLACDAGGLKTASQLDDRDYTNFICSDVWPEHVDFEIVDFAQHDKDAEKVYVLTNSPTDVALITQHLSMEMYLVVDRVGFAMIMHREATKAAAVAELARIWGIDAADIVAFGDDLNDIDMLNHAGVGVAMGNAVEEVKAIADYICPSNEEDGLARWLQEYVLEL